MNPLICPRCHSDNLQRLVRQIRAGDEINIYYIACNDCHRIFRDFPPEPLE